MDVKLRIDRDARGNTEYKLEDGSGIRTVSESLARYRVVAGEIENAFIDDTGSIKLKEEVKINGLAGIKTEARIKKELEASSMVGDAKYRIVATLREGGALKGYVLKDDTKLVEKRVSQYTAIIYTSIGAIINAKIEYTADGKEYLTGIGINLNNLAVIDTLTGVAEDSNTNKMRIADGVIDVYWKDVRQYKKDSEHLEMLDKRVEMLDGLKYPKTTLMSKSRLTISVDRVEYQVTVSNLDDIIKDETDTMVVSLKQSVSGEVTKVMCLGTNYIELNVLMIAIVALLGIRKLNRKAKLLEVSLMVTDGRMWRLFYKDEDAIVDQSELQHGTEITNDMLQALRSMYSMSVDAVSSTISEEEQTRLLRGLKIGKAVLKVMCQGETYTVTEMLLRVTVDTRVDFTMVSSSGETLSYYYGKLRADKINIKNICVICASAVAKRSEIQRVSIEAVGRDSEFLVEFRSKIRFS